MRILCCCVFAMALFKGVSALCPSESVVEADGYRYSRFDDARAQLQAIDSCIFSSYNNLAVIKTPVASEAVHQLIRGCEDEFYFGLEYEDSVDPSSWYWADGSPLKQEQSRWESGYGNAADCNCACVFSSNQTWIDVDCVSAHPYICERNLLIITSDDPVQWKTVGDNVTFTVGILSVDGPVNLTMYKDQDQSKPLHTKIDVTSGTVVEFKLESITSDDNGTYIIVASREGYERTASVVINVQVPVTIVSDFPKEIASPVTRGLRTIECKAKGYPTPTIHWQINHVSVREGSTGPGVYQITHMNVTTLYIEHAVSTDDGIYVCVAENNFFSPEQQYNDTRSTRLRVFGPPTIHGSEIMINCTENEIKVRLSLETDNQTLGINHIIEIRNASESLLHESNITASNQSIIFTNITLIPTKELQIEVTVCPDDCITILNDSRTISNPTPNPVMDANVTKVNGTLKKSICRVWWTWTEFNDADGPVNFKLHQISVPLNVRNQSELYVKETLLSPVNNSFTYGAEVEPNTNNTFDVFVTNCIGGSAGVRARGKCEIRPRGPYNVSAPSTTESPDDSATTHSISFDTPDETNGLISCLFLVVRHGGGNVEPVNLTRLKTLSENSITDLIPQDGNEYIADSIPMYTISDKDNVAVKLGANKTSLCDVIEISSSDRAQSQSNTVYYGFNWPLEINSTYSVSLVSTTPSDSHEVFIAQSETLSFRHEFIETGTDGQFPEYTRPPIRLPLPPPCKIWSCVWGPISILLILLILLCMCGVFGGGAWGFISYGRCLSRKTSQASEFANTQHEMTRPTTNTPTAKPSGELLRTFVNLTKNEGMDLLAEFKRVKEQANSIDECASVGSSAAVKKKNRYNNVIPYDNSRVSLIASEGSSIVATYVNASYIRGYHQGFERPRKFIATQGPLPSTIDDFWQMVMQEKARVIAMVTNLVENNKRKCECYWPDVCTSGEYGNITVSTVSQHRIGGRTKRIFELTHRSSRHRVIQYQLMNWPDHGVPNSTTNFLRFYKACMETQENNEEPIIVHCSAGAGRTGTFIAYDYLIHKAMNHEAVDPFACVLTMRGQRMDMVQTSDQYQFIYRLVAEYDLFKDSDLDINIFYSDVSVNKPADPQLRRQVENLKVAASFPKIAPEKAAITIHVPVRWRPEDGENIPRIDAVRVETYDASFELIACIPPTKATAEIFWRLSLDNEIQFMVSINDLSLDPQESVNECWPSEEHIKRAFASVSVTLLNSDDKKHFQVNTIRVQREPSLQTKEIRQYNILKWRPKVALEVINDVQSAISRMSTSKPRRILVHCRRDFGETGSFCALINLLSRMDTEERVDVFRTAKDLKDAHVGLIQDQKQYKFCYDALRSYDRASGRKSSESTSQYQNHSAYENEPATTGNRATGRKNSEKTSPSQNNSPYENEPATTSL